MSIYGFACGCVSMVEKAVFFKIIEFALARIEYFFFFFRHIDHRFFFVYFFFLLCLFVFVFYLYLESDCRGFFETQRSQKRLFNSLSNIPGEIPILEKKKKAVKEKSVYILYIFWTTLRLKKNKNKTKCIYSCMEEKEIDLLFCIAR